MVSYPQSVMLLYWIRQVYICNFSINWFIYRFKGDSCFNRIKYWYFLLRSMFLRCMFCKTRLLATEEIRSHRMSDVFRGACCQIWKSSNDLLPSIHELKFSGHSIIDPYEKKSLKIDTLNRQINFAGKRAVECYFILKGIKKPEWNIFKNLQDLSHLPLNNVNSKDNDT